MNIQSINSTQQSFGMPWANSSDALSKINKEAVDRKVPIGSDKYKRAIEEDWRYIEQETPYLVDFSSTGDSSGDLYVRETRKKGIFRKPENVFYLVKSNPDLGDDFFNRFHDSVEKLRFRDKKH